MRALLLSPPITEAVGSTPLLELYLLRPGETSLPQDEACPASPLAPDRAARVDQGLRLPKPPTSTDNPPKAPLREPGDGSVDDGPSGVQIRTFLIADVRGYTLFTQERGDEVAGKLAAKFTDIARESVEARGGRLLELRGDEALCVFASTREAIRGAVDLQPAFLTPSTP